LEIRAERTNNTWRLTEPLVYAAQAASIEELLAYLERLAPATYISTSELRRRPARLRNTALLRPRLLDYPAASGLSYSLAGRRADGAGDQVYLQVVNSEGAYVVEAELLKLIPQSVNDWRDTALINLDWLALDRLAVTNNTKGFVLARAATNRLWRMIWPLDQARADNARIQDSLQKLQAMRIQRFVTDDPAADLEAYGLARPELELGLGHGTNPPVLLQFGRSATNAANQVYARRAGRAPS